MDLLVLHLALVAVVALVGLQAQTILATTAALAVLMAVVLAAVLER
jgi:hypothetical protein